VRPNLLLPHLWEVLLEPFLQPFAFLRHELTSSHSLSLYLKSSDTIILTAFVIEIFISCTSVLMCLPWALVMTSSGLEDSQDGQQGVAAPLMHFLVFISVSADPPETKNSPTFFIMS
jgi:ABC-type transport system involved in multi-copper enzyme maturation permease subunit